MALIDPKFPEMSKSIAGEIVPMPTLPSSFMVILAAAVADVGTWVVKNVKSEEPSFRELLCPLTIAL